MRIAFYIIALIITLPQSVLQAQLNEPVYFVQFTDKPASAYSLTHPSEYLSVKAIERRSRFNINIEADDLPLNQSYIDKIVELGFSIKFKSKWMNGVGVELQNPEDVERVLQLSFVSRLELIHLPTPIEGGLKSKKFDDEASSSIKKMNTINLDTGIYGQGFNQIKMVGGDNLHQMGLKGRGIDIAVIDNGFLNADKLRAFDSLWMNKQVLSTYDVVKNSEIQFSEGSHGTKVLSIMAANIPGFFTGTAPQANYHLIRTEIESIESLIEEYYWLCGAEYADSCGADIINSSLGYTTFDHSEMDHTNAELDGNTAIVTRAADKAASKGMLVVTSAGNSGNKAWQYISAPADADSILAVGAVDENKYRAAFSSIGPSSDGRIKPDIVAQGQNTAFINQFGELNIGNGTSFSSPVIAGMSACLLQGTPASNNLEIIELIKKSSDRYQFPDFYYGHGIPDFNIALQLYDMKVQVEANQAKLIKLFPNPFISELSIFIASDYQDQIQISLLDINGKTLYSSLNLLFPGVNYFKISDLNAMARGIYFLQLNDSRSNSVHKLIKF